MRLIFTFAFLFISVSFALAQPAQQQETPSVLLPGSYWENDRKPLQIGEMAPNWKLPLAPDSPFAKKEKTLDFSRFRGEKTTVVVFWAFWCDTWKDATDFFEKKRAEMEKRGVKLVIVAVDASQQPVARPAFKSGKLWFPIVIDEKSEITARYGVRRVPTIFVVGKDAKMRAMWEGLPHKKVFSKAIKP
jgi:alkyl hydroperoxide reductase subunit AhpC